MAFTGDTIVLEPGGKYTTRGPWQFVNYMSLQPGVKLVATGATIKLTDAVRAWNGVQRPDHDLPILNCGANTSITGGLWDADWKGQGGWFAQGIRFWGKFRIEGAKIIGLSGSRKSGTPTAEVESFGISSEGDTSGSLINSCQVSDCKVDSADDYVSGIFMGATAPGTEISLVTYCDVELGVNGQHAYSANTWARFSNCAGEASRWWYCDTLGDSRVTIKDSTGKASWAAISSVATGNVRRDIWVNDCTFQAPRLVEWWQKTGNLDGSVTITNTEFAGKFYLAASAPKGDMRFLGCSLGAATQAVSGTVRGVVL